MTKAIKVKVTDKMDFEEHDALRLGDIMTFDGWGGYTFSDGIREGTYRQEWLEQMLASGAFAEILSERSFQGLDAPEWATAVARFRGAWYWEEDVEQSNGARFRNTEGELVFTYDKHSIKGWDQYKILPAFVEEQLPPAPDSVMYFNSESSTDNLQHLLVQPHWELDNHLTVAVVKSGCKFDPYAYGDVLSINLDPDSALQLASDLRRMAMDIKRKQKGN